MQQWGIQWCNSDASSIIGSGICEGAATHSGDPHRQALSHQMADVQTRLITAHRVFISQMRLYRHGASVRTAPARSCNILLLYLAQLRCHGRPQLQAETSAGGARLEKGDGEQWYGTSCMSRGRL